MSMKDYKYLVEKGKLPGKPPRRKNKFNAKSCYCDGIFFHSTLEKDFYLRLKLLQMAKEIVYFHRQVKFDLPGGIEYRADFLILYPDGHLEYVDIKGIMTPEAKIKIKQTEHLYGVKIKIVKRGQF